MTTRNGSVFRFRLPLALGIAAAIPALGVWAQAQDTPPPASAGEQAERKADESRAKARQAREAELKALAEQLRQKREAIEAEEALEKNGAEARRRDVAQQLAQLQVRLAEHLTEATLLDLRIETTKDALKAVWKRIIEAQLQQALRGPSPDATHDAEAIAILKKQADTYERQLRDCIGRKVLLAEEGKDLDRDLNRARVRVGRPTASTRSVAESVDRLLGNLNDQGAIDETDHRHLNNAIGALEELIDIFRDYRRGTDTDKEIEPAVPEVQEPK